MYTAINDRDFIIHSVRDMFRQPFPGYETLDRIIGEIQKRRFIVKISHIRTNHDDNLEELGGIYTTRIFILLIGGIRCGLFSDYYKSFWKYEDGKCEWCVDKFLPSTLDSNPSMKYIIDNITNHDPSPQQLSPPSLPLSVNEAESRYKVLLRLVNGNEKTAFSPAGGYKTVEHTAIAIRLQFNKIYEKRPDVRTEWVILYKTPTAEWKIASDLIILSGNQTTFEKIIDYTNLEIR